VEEDLDEGSKKRKLGCSDPQWIVNKNFLKKEKKNNNSMMLCYSVTVS
jgi:hypothetical protein